MSEHTTDTSPELRALRSLEITYRPLAGLVPLGRKTRSHPKTQIAQLAESIRQFGFNVPVLVDDDGKLLAGNARVEAARQMGMTEAPTVQLAHLSPEQKRAFVIAENRLAELAGWQRDALKTELEELSELDLDFSLELTGFSEAEIDALVLGGDGAAERGDDLPAMREQIVSQIGDLWVLGDHKLLCGDSTDPVCLQALLSGELARTVFTDPPYNVAIGGHVTSGDKHGEFVMASGEMSNAEFDGFLGKSCQLVAASLIEGGLAYICMDWRHMSQLQRGAEASQLQLLNLIIWDKMAGGMGSFYRSQHELIFLYRKGGAGHLNRVQLGSNGRNRTNVWAYAGVNGFGSAKAKAREMHPTVKPLAMVRDAILDSSARGEVVLDLFSGSGTTLIAAEQSGRRGRAIELDPRYVDVGVIRWQDFTGKQARLLSTGQTFNEVRAERWLDAAPPQPPVRARVRTAS